MGIRIIGTNPTYSVGFGIYRKLCYFLCEQKVTKESFQGEEETKVSYLPLKVTPSTLLMGIIVSVCNRVYVGADG